MFGWFKRKPKPEPRALVIGGEPARIACSLIDKVTRDKECDALARYDLWTFIHRLYPETEVGTWRVDTKACTIIIIREVL